MRLKSADSGGICDGDCALGVIKGIVNQNYNSNSSSLRSVVTVGLEEYSNCGYGRKPYIIYSRGRGGLVNVNVKQISEIRLRFDLCSNWTTARRNDLLPDLILWTLVTG